MLKKVECLPISKTHMKLALQISMECPSICPKIIITTKAITSEEMLNAKSIRYETFLCCLVNFLCLGLYNASYAYGSK